MQVTRSDQRRKPGLFYAETDDGQRLPIIDVTDPAFAIELGTGELDHRLQAHIRAFRVTAPAERLSSSG